MRVYISHLLSALLDPSLVSHCPLQDLYRPSHRVPSVLPSILSDPPCMHHVNTTCSAVCVSNPPLGKQSKFTYLSLTESSCLSGLFPPDPFLSSAIRQNAAVVFEISYLTSMCLLARSLQHPQAVLGCGSARLFSLHDSSFPSSLGATLRLHCRLSHNTNQSPPAHSFLPFRTLTLSSSPLNATLTKW